jgi:aminoglycoside 6-adenylyltransferase
VDTARVLEDIVRWAGAEDNIRLVVLTGSAARGPEATDDLSDLDLELYVEEPQQLLGDHSWYQPFGEVLVVEALDAPGWHPSRLIYYLGGKVDFSIIPVECFAREQYERAFAVLIDKDGRAPQLEGAPLPDRPMPTSPELQESVHWFYAAALMCAKALYRQELLTAKTRDVDLKAQLIRMIEWDHRARYGEDYDTWYRGAHWQAWMDADVRQSLHGCWGYLAAHDAARALICSLELFEVVATRTAARLGCEPFDHARVAGEVRRTLARLEG